MDAPPPPPRTCVLTAPGSIGGFSGVSDWSHGIGLFHFYTSVCFKK